MNAKRFATALAILALAGAQAALAQVTGAVFTTDSACSGVDLNIYDAKEDVYLNGGPSHPHAAGLPDGLYYVQVTEPGGALLGTSVGSANPTPVLVASGSFVACYQLSSILIKASDSTPGYDTTSNPGGEYKVWVSMDPAFVNSSTKTDNFKVQAGEITPPSIQVLKFYDANANGIDDDGLPLAGWAVHIVDNIDYLRFTPVNIFVAPDIYTVSEFFPIETNWVATTPTSVSFPIADGQTQVVKFGNVCLGGGGGLTLGFWSNKNGQAVMTAAGMSSELAALSALNLRNASGSNFDPATYAGFRTWLLNATATNMAYMLSAQLAAMKLNVLAGFVNPASIVYSPVLGFITVGNLLAAADASLGANGLTLSGSPDRAAQEALKNALDAANNNQNFVQPVPCPYTFP
jgi:hypothetical protein